MEKNNVIVYDERIDWEDSWRELFLSALERRAHIKSTKFFSDFFYFEKDPDILIYVRRRIINQVRNNIISGFVQQLNTRLVALGYDVAKEEIPAGFIGVSQKDFSSEEELINAILGE